MMDTETRYERFYMTRKLSIFDLAKNAQARSRNSSMDESFFISKKQRQYIEPTTIDIYEPSSPESSSSICSEAEDDNWLSTDDLDEIIENESATIQRHRDAALAALEGRAPIAEYPEPLMRSARMDYEDHVEAEHGQLYLFAPRPRRPIARTQSAIKSWEEMLVQDQAEAEEKVVPKPEQCTKVNDVLDWLNDDSPVDLLRGKPIFYRQSTPVSDDFWAEISIEELNAESEASLRLREYVL